MPPIKPNDILQTYRQDISDIDNQLHQLIIKRSQIVAKIADEKAKNNLPFFQPDREALILRTLIENHKGSFPITSLFKIWREIISSNLSLQCDFLILTHRLSKNAAAHHMLHEYFGDNVKTHNDNDIDAILSAIGYSSYKVALLSSENDKNIIPWWVIISEKYRHLHVIMKYPFFDEKSKNTVFYQRSYIIAHYSYQNTGQDQTLLVLKSDQNISDHNIKNMLQPFTNNMAILDRYKQQKNYILIEIDGFINKPLEIPSDQGEIYILGHCPKVTLTNRAD